MFAFSGLVRCGYPWRSGLPPSVLPDISPTRGEIRCRARPFHGQGVSRLSISPLEGEMPGRAEGGEPQAKGVF
ncbi:hypothetical protein G6M80_18475 [Rhizobium pusense]|nr:hypothetical protein [Agrobacterium pusense]